MSDVYVYEHIVTFEETNLVGNVYFSNFLKWQGTCREMFIRDYAPDVLEKLKKDLALVTVNVSAEFFQELYAFDLVRIKMSLVEIIQNRLTMKFQYFRVSEQKEEELAAIGQQQIACVKKEGENYVAHPIPYSLKSALDRYAN